MTGQTFDRLTVLRRSENRGRRVMWLMSCDHGGFGAPTEFVASGSHSFGGHTKSCGCWHSEMMAARRGADHPSWVAIPGYAAAHYRVSSARGQARDQGVCDWEGCALPANEWSYDHDDPNESHELRRGVPRSYSADPSHYRALCRPHHRAFDHAHAALTREVA